MKSTETTAASGIAPTSRAHTPMHPSASQTQTVSELPGGIAEPFLHTEKVTA